MITDLIINAFLLVPYLLLNGFFVLDFNFSLFNNFFDIFNSLSSGIGYVFPIAGLTPIFTISLAIYTFRIVWSIILRVKSFIPTMGA